MPRLECVFVDTATLCPISLADLVLRLPEFGIYDLLWSDHLLSEVERVLVEYKGLTVERARYFCECISTAFPSGRVAPREYLPLVATRTGPDPDEPCTHGTPRAHVCVLACLRALSPVVGRGHLGPRLSRAFRLSPTMTLTSGERVILEHRERYHPVHRRGWVH